MTLHVAIFPRDTPPHETLLPVPTMLDASTPTRTSSGASHTPKTSFRTGGLVRVKRGGRVHKPFLPGSQRRPHWPAGPQTRMTLVRGPQRAARMARPLCWSCFFSLTVSVSSFSQMQRIAQRVPGKGRGAHVGARLSVCGWVGISRQPGASPIFAHSRAASVIVIVSECACA